MHLVQVYYCSPHLPLFFESAILASVGFSTHPQQQFPLFTASDSCQDDGSPSGVQVVGMSATLPNLEMLATWLNAALYVTEYRPVPLSETIKVGQTIFDSNMQKISEINTDDMVKGDEEHVIPLCLETIRDCHSVLIFCPTKQWCEKLAKNIADSFKLLLMTDNVEEVDVNVEDRNTNVRTTENTRTGFLDANSIAEVIEQLRRSPVGLDKTLADVVSSGVSFHHAGLTFDERDIVEGAFKRGAIRVLVATSTLSSGNWQLRVFTETILELCLHLFDLRT